MCAAANIDHAGLIREPDARLGEAATALSALSARRLASEPVSRILGRREFWGLALAIGPDVLDPRPETEGLVASILDGVGGRRAAPLKILDLGTGSGAILAALLRELPGASGIGIDRSHAACAIASRNLRTLGLADRGAILCGNWGDAIGGRFDIVVSNPPYIVTREIASLAADVRDFDPHGALDGGVDGLAAYRAIAPRLPMLLAIGGIAALECGTGQGFDVRSLLVDAGLAAPAVYRDLAGHDRIVLSVNSQPARP